MDNHIIIPNSDFLFDGVSLESPIALPGSSGSYFTKILYEGKPFIIQTTKSTTRQGIVKSGAKKMYCDLMFDNLSETIIQWLEGLENRCKQLLFQKSDLWFQNPLTIDDIDSAFTSIIKIYKSGKFYLVRTNILIHASTGEPTLKIYNENYTPVPIDEITESTNIISILEVQGIRFSAKNFQIDITLKQMMILEDERIFDKPLIKKDIKSTTPISKILLNESESEPTFTNNINELKPVILSEQELYKYEPTNIEEKSNVNASSSSSANIDDIYEGLGEEVNLEPEPEEEVVDLDNLDNLDNLENSLNKQDVLEEVEPIIEENENGEENITALKNPKEVYYNLYKKAKNKAIEAKKAVILAYLEAKNIKNTFMLENIDNDNFDKEIETVDETQLKDFI